MTSFSSRITIGNNTDTETSAGLKFYGTVKYSGQLQPADDYILNGDIFGGWFKYKPDAKMLRTGYRTYDAKPVSEGGEGGAYVFKKQFTVKYMNPEAMGGGIWQTKQVLYGDTITVESTAGWSKYLLKSWNLNGKTVYAYDSIVVTDNLTFTPNCVIAQARIGGTYYEYLQDAVNAADNKDTINLVSDCGSAVTIAGKTLTINLNNCTISGNNGYGMLNVREGAKLTVNGPGTIKNSNKSNTACAIYVDKNELIVNGCTLEGNSGIVTNPKETSTVKASSCKITGTGLNGIGTGKKSGKGFITLELINCVIVGAQAGIDLSGYEAGGKVDIKGGSIKGKDGDDDVAIIFGVAMSVVITGVA